MEDKYQRYQNTAFTSQQWYIIKKAIDDDIEVKDIADGSGYQGRTAQTDIGKDSK